MSKPIEAPERIWATKPNSKCVVSFDEPSLDYNIEYVRADLATPVAPEPAADVVEAFKVTDGMLKAYNDAFDAHWELHPSTKNDDAKKARIAAALSHAQAGWQPIGTAPKDGSWLIVRLRNGEVFRACWYLYGSPGWHVASDIGFVNPTHWVADIPLPSALGGE